MTDAEIQKLSLVQAIKLITSGEVSADELLVSITERIERINPAIGAFITLIPNDSTGRHSAPLYGVPVSVKDLFDTKDVRTTAGSKVFANRIPAEDATAVKKLRSAGAMIVGKTNLHEFAFGLTTINPHYGTTRNP